MLLQHSKTWHHPSAGVISTLHFYSRLLGANGTIRCCWMQKTHFKKKTELHFGDYWIIQCFSQPHRHCCFQSRWGPAYYDVGALHMLQWCFYQPNIFCWFGPCSQAGSCLPAQTRKSSGSIQGPDVESSWQTSLLVCETYGVAEQLGCCDSVTPAGLAQFRKSISRTSYSVSILRCPGSEDNGLIWERTSRWDVDGWLFANR